MGLGSRVLEFGGLGSGLWGLDFVVKFVLVTVLFSLLA